MPKEEIEKLLWQRNKFMNEICQRTWKELYRFIYYKVQNREEAEDITQETYERVLNILNKKEIEIIEYNSYLKAISLNIIRDHWRVKQRKGRSINIEEVNPEEIMTEDFTDTITNQTLIKRAMESLTKDQQTVITLRIIKGFPSTETAKIMNKKEATVRVLQYRAIKALAHILNDINK